jgi:hypothetical protein
MRQAKICEAWLMTFVNQHICLLILPQHDGVLDDKRKIVAYPTQVAVDDVHAMKVRKTLCNATDLRVI